MFAYLYVHQVIFGRIKYLNSISRYIITEMGSQDQVLLYSELQKVLIQRGFLNETTAAIIGNATLG